MNKYNILLNHDPLVTKDDFKGTYESAGAAKYHYKKGLNFLIEREIVPLKFTTPQLLNLNILAGWTMWSGSLRGGYNTEIHIPNKKYIPGLEEKVSKLGSSLRQERDKIVSLSTNGAYLTRVLEQLEVPKTQGTSETPEKSVERELNLPYYLEYLTQKYNELRGNEKRMAAKVLSDQCKILIFNAKNSKNEYKITTPANKEKKKTEKLAKKIVKMFNRVYPEIGLNEESIKSHFHKKRENWYSGIFLNHETIVKATYNYHLFEIHPFPKYHPTGKKAGAWKN